MMIGQHRKVFPNPGMSSPLPLTDEIFGAFWLISEETDVSVLAEVFMK
jgi:hypothetical protein